MASTSEGIYYPTGNDPAQLTQLMHAMALSVTAKYADVADAAQQALAEAQRATEASFAEPDAAVAALLAGSTTATRVALSEAVGEEVGPAVNTALSSAGPTLHPDRVPDLSGTYARPGEIVIDPRRYGAVGDAQTSGAGSDDGAALEAALTVAHNTTFVAPNVARRVHLTGGFYKSSRDLSITSSDVEITGEGTGTGILLNGKTLLIDGRDGLLMRNAVRNLRVRRVGTPGLAFGILGGGMNSGTYPTRWALDHVEIESVGGAALRLAGTFLGTCTSVYLRNAVDGLVIDYDDDAGNLSANAISFHGGEIQGVTNIGRITGAIGVSFHGMAWEGSSGTGMDVNETDGLSVFGPYWEANAGYDLRVGHSSVCYGVTVHGGTASVGAKPKDRSIILRRSLGTSIAGVYFASYNAPPVWVDEASPGLVTGQAYPCHHSRGAIPVVQVSAGRDWDARTFHGPVTIGDGSGLAALYFNGADGQQKTTFYRTASSQRWAQGTDAVSESGNNLGTNWQLIAYNDSGGYLGQALTVYRADQRTRIHGPLHHSGATAGFFGRFPAAQPTGVPATAEGIHAALVSLGLITA